MRLGGGAFAEVACKASDTVLLCRWLRGLLRSTFLMPRRLMVVRGLPQSIAALIEESASFIEQASILIRPSRVFAPALSFVVPVPPKHTLDQGTRSHSSSSCWPATSSALASSSPPWPVGGFGSRLRSKQQPFRPFWAKLINVCVGGKQTFSIYVSIAFV